jgi:hypothetical protein
MITKKLLQEKKILFELILIVIIIGLSIEFLSNGLTSLFDLDKGNGIFLGSLMLIVGFSYFLFKIIKLKTTSETIDGFIIYDNKKNKIIDVPKYEYANELSDDFNCAFTENPALKKIWDAEPISHRFPKKSNKHAVFTNPKSYKLIYEATEYFILKQLSLHLSAHFNDDKHDKTRLKEFNRKDIPSILLENRFLELFSRPMEERDAFVSDTLSQDEGVGKIVASYRDGVKYELFDLVLPINSKILKPKGNEILIKTSRFKFKFSVNFQGMGSVTPYAFEKYYLNHKNPRDLSGFCIQINTTVNFTLKGYFTRKGWEYFEWIDSFMKELDEDFSEKTFWKRINWNTINSAIIIAENMKKK